MTNNNINAIATAAIANFNTELEELSVSTLTEMLLNDPALDGVSASEIYAAAEEALSA